MSDRRFAIIDPAAGASGDMLLCALIAVGADPAWLRELPSRLGLDGVSVEFEPADRCGVACTKVTVRLPDGSWEAPADTGAHQAAQAEDHDHHHHDHGHVHHHDHSHVHHHDHGRGHQHGPHRRVGELIARIQQAGLSDWVRDRALRAFRLLGEAEGRVHGVPAEDVTLHEVGAWDALVDIVGAVEGFERLGIHEIRVLYISATFNATKESGPFNLRSLLLSTHFFKIRSFFPQNTSFTLWLHQEGLVNLEMACVSLHMPLGFGKGEETLSFGFANCSD